MGFKYRRIDFRDLSVGSNFGVWYNWGSRDDNSLYRAKCIISSFAAALEDMGIGWELDGSYGIRWESDLDYIGGKVVSLFYDMPVADWRNTRQVSSEDVMPIIFMRNSISGNKLLLSYNASSCNVCVWLPSGQLASSGSYGIWGPSGDGPSYTGLLLSMIPGDSSDVFGDVSSGSLIPVSGTRLYGLCEACRSSYTSGSGNKACYGRVSLQNRGLWYSFGVLATPYCVAVACDCSPKLADGEEEPVYPVHLQLCCAVGRIFSSLAHDESLPQACYGVIQFSIPSNSEASEKGNCNVVSSGVIKYWTANGISFEAGVEEMTYGCKSMRNGFGSSNSANNCYSLGNIFKADGSAIGLTSTSNIRIQPDPYLQLSGNVFSSEYCSGLRWVPFIVGVVSSDLEHDGIVSGDGNKGILDTDLFRCARVSEGLTFSSGMFLSLKNNLLIGWDPSNSML